MSISEIAIKRSTLVVVVFTALSLLGLLCYSKLNYELIPKTDMPVITVSTTYSGASADEVESSVTKKLEDALSSLSNVKYMSSSSQEGSSTISIELEANTNIDNAVQDAQRKINSALYQLPDAVKTPSLTSFSSDDIPILKLGVTAQIDERKLYQLTKDEIKPQISKISGVGQVSLIGGDEREIKINVDRSKLESYKISIGELYNKINNANQEYATGKIQGEQNQYTVRLSGKITSLEKLKNTVISKSEKGATIKLSDIAEIVDGVAEYSNHNRINGDNSIGIQIQKNSDANSVSVSQNVKNELSKIESQYSQYNLKFNIASDNSTYTIASANAVIEDLGIAILLVAIVMFLFLHSFRNSLIVMVSIPTSLISVFTGMYIFNFSLNIMTLMGLSLVIGILVDDSIVVLENISRHLALGKDKKTAALEGRKEIGFTAVAITMVDVVVFAPMAVISGMIGNILKEFALVVVFSTLMSLLVSFTITPLLASRFAKIETLNPKNLTGKLGLIFEIFYNRLLGIYERVLRWGLNNRKTIYFTVTILTVSSFYLIIGGYIGTEFMPNSDRGEFVVKIEGDPQNTLTQTNQLSEKVEKLLTNKPEVIKIFANIGYSSSETGSAQYKSELTVSIVDKNLRKTTIEQYAANIKKEILSNVPGVKITSTPSSIMGSSDAPIQILLCGNDMSEIYAVADSVISVVREVNGTNDIKLSVEKSKPEIHVELDREKMTLLDLNVATVGITLQYALASNTDLQYSDNGKNYNINIQFDQFDRKNIDNIKAITFCNSKNQIVKLEQFANIVQSLGPNKLERYDRMSSITVGSEVYGRPSGTVGSEIKDLIAKKIHPQNVTIEMKGETEEQSDAFGSLFGAMFAAILLVYFVMVVLYNSYLSPFIVLFSLPVAMIGAFLALALAGQNLSIFTLIGVIMLMGLVAKNAILLVDFTNQLRNQGRELVEALVEAGKERLRPILMTTIAMVFGMFPLAISSGAASENRNGLAWVIIGGLTSSLLLTIILVPSVYYTSEKLKQKFTFKTK